jgi:glyoxylase-like metal-dependent hydrolase (beta-lactamase superfamily II)
VPHRGFDVAAWTTPAHRSDELRRRRRCDRPGRPFVRRPPHPGHTAGSICLLDDANGTIFTGDAIYVDARLGWEDPEAFAASLIRLRDLDVRVAHSGHGRSFDASELRATVGATLAALG